MRKLLLLTLAFAAVAAPAHAAEATATIAANSVSGVTYNGTDGPDAVTLSAVAGRVTVDNAGPLKINAGCLPVAGDSTKATCTIFRGANGQFLGITALGHDGNDTITNNRAVRMFAAGGNGADKLVGGSGNDQLSGEAGDFDSVQGRGGDDILSGGAGVHDLVNYADHTVGVFAVLKDSENTTGNGTFNEEDDRIDSDVEDLGGSVGGDFLSGDSGPNTLAGGSGNDTLVGGPGADSLIGGDDDDILLSNSEIFGGPLFDGAADALNGSAGQDACGGAPSEGDTKVKCEF
jgi:Ca2+-binding RTX toxin-like protein